MAELERERYETVFLVGQTVDAQPAADDGKAGFVIRRVRAEGQGRSKLHPYAGVVTLGRAGSGAVTFGRRGRACSALGTRVQRVPGRVPAPRANRVRSADYSVQATPS